MRFLIEILIKHHVFFIFIFLVFFCLSLILKINPYNEVKLLNGVRNLIYTSLATENNLVEYFKLKKINLKLSEENNQLISDNEQLKFENAELQIFKKNKDLIFQKNQERFNYIPTKIKKKKLDSS